MMCMSFNNYIFKYANIKRNCYMKNVKCKRSLQTNAVELHVCMWDSNKDRNVGIRLWHVFALCILSALE